MVSTCVCTLDLAVFIPTYTVVLVLASMYDPTQLSSIGLHIGITMYMDVATWSRKQSDLMTLLEVKFDLCHVST